MVEKESGMPIKCLRTNRGGEFNSAKFNDFCKQHGVKRQLITTYTPQQNGVVERKNCTIINLVSSMLTKKKVPKNFLHEAVRWTIYILNRSLTLVVEDMILEEPWSGVKPLVDYFRIFGCVDMFIFQMPREANLKIKCNMFYLESAANPKAVE